MRRVAVILFAALAFVACGEDDDYIAPSGWSTVTDPMTGRSFRCYYSVSCYELDPTKYGG